MWFDRNQDGVRGKGEWPLPGVRVELKPDSSVGAAMAATSNVVHTTTGPDGRYRFEKTVPGAYVVVASVNAAGFSYTSDTDGLGDWTVRVTVAGSASVTASFAGVGKGTVSGAVYTSTTRAPISGAEVTCRWAGFDDVPGTADDVLMPVTADARGSFDLTQVPYGGYSCTGRDPVAGTESAAANVTVMSAKPARAQLPIPLGVTGVEPGSPSGGQLPRTGSPMARLVALAFGLLLAGAGTIVLARRRPGTP